MAKRKVAQEEGSEDEGGAPISTSNTAEEESDEETPKPREKKAKKVSKKPGDGSGVSNKIELGKGKFVDVREFKGMILIDIREYYQNADGEMKPGKKGIALNPDQWKTLQESMDEISDKVEALQG